MIKIRIRNADHEIDIRFPISESELFAKLGEIHAVEGRDAAQSALVTEVYWPEEFSMLKDHFANLDELNYLGKRMESFDTLEYDQFLIGIFKLGYANDCASQERPRCLFRPVLFLCNDFTCFAGHRGAAAFLRQSCHTMLCFDK